MSLGSMEVVGQYEFDRTKVLGHGAFAVVYKGQNRVTPTHNVAVKVISKKQKAGKLISAEEINILKEIQHKNVVQLFDFNETDARLYMVMEFCNGGDLADYLRDKGTLSEETLQIFVKQLGRAILAIHKCGVMHRDLKPGNILLSYPTTITRVQPCDIKLKIADFGFARFLNDEDMAATLCGSPIYMAPEVLMGLHYDSRVDLWSLGTIIYQCYMGKAPFKASNPYSLRSLYEKSPELVPHIPNHMSPHLKSFILALLQKNPDKRIPFEELINHQFLDSSVTPPHISRSMTPERPLARAASDSPSPTSSPSHNISRSPNSSSSNKLASMSRMKANIPRPLPVVTPRPTPCLEESISASPETDGFVVVNRKTPTKLKSFESSFQQKTTAISSSVKTTAVAIPVKHNYPPVPCSSSPGTLLSPIAQKLVVDDRKDSIFARVESKRIVANRNVSAPNFSNITRTLSFDAHKRHRATSESGKKSTPPLMEIVSKSVRQSAVRRPFSANFDDSYHHNYNPNPLSSSRVSAGQSAPAYFFVGGSPHTSPPSLTQSPLQLTYGETSPPFVEPPELSETTMMDDYQREMLDEFHNNLQYCQAIREAVYLLEVPFSFGQSDNKAHEKLLLCQKAEAILSSTIHLAKDQLFRAKLSPSKTFKDILFSIYGEFCATHDTRAALEKGLASKPVPQTCPEEILLSFALKQVQSAILDENLGHIAECIKRYRLSKAIVQGLLSEVKCDGDKAILLRYETGIQLRLDLLQGKRRAPP